VKGPEGFLLITFVEMSDILNFLVLISSIALLISDLFLKENFSTFLLFS